MTETSDRHAFYLELPGRRAGGGALILDTAGRALIVAPTYKRHGDSPGASSKRPKTHAPPATASVRRNSGWTSRSVNSQCWNIRLSHHHVGLDHVCL